MIGPYNDPAKKGNFSYVVWVVWEGKHMEDCTIKRYVVATAQWAGKTTIMPDGNETGYVKGKKITAQGSKNDTPRPGNIRPEDPKTFIAVADAPGMVKLQPGWYPIFYRANFYEVAISKKDGKIKGEIWYDVVIEAKGPGKAEVNTCVKTASEVTK
jgi:hypothetical protein